MNAGWSSNCETFSLFLQRNVLLQRFQLIEQTQFITGVLDTVLLSSKNGYRISEGPCIHVASGCQSYRQATFRTLGHRFYTGGLAEVKRREDAAAVLARGVGPIKVRYQGLSRLTCSLTLGTTLHRGRLSSPSHPSFDRVELRHLSWF